MTVACKNGTRPSILALGGHGGGDALIGLSLLAYGFHGARVQELYKSIHFGVGGGMEVVMLLLVLPFWRMGGMVDACKDCISRPILAYGWHGGSDVMIGPSILAYGWHGAS
jgi:hypothetical protein